MVVVGGIAAAGWRNNRSYPLRVHFACTCSVPVLETFLFFIMMQGNDDCLGSISGSWPAGWLGVARPARCARMLSLFFFPS